MRGGCPWKVGENRGRPGGRPGQEVWLGELPGSAARRWSSDPESPQGDPGRLGLGISSAWVTQTGTPGGAAAAGVGQAQAGRAGRYVGGTGGGSRHEICGQTRALPRTCWKSRSRRPRGTRPVGGSRTQEVSEGNTPSPGAARQSRVGQTSQLLMSCFEYFIRRRRGEAESAGGSDGGLTRRSWTSNYPGQRSL